MLQYMLYSLCFSWNVSAEALGSAASAAALAQVVIQNGGVGTVPRFVGMMNAMVPFFICVLVRAKCPSLVVYGMMDNALASMAS